MNFTIFTIPFPATAMYSSDIESFRDSSVCLVFPHEDVKNFDKTDRSCQ
jgi:hypothetical protein